MIADAVAAGPDLLATLREENLNVYRASLSSVKGKRPPMAIRFVHRAGPRGDVRPPWRQCRSVVASSLVASAATVVPPPMRCRCCTTAVRAR